MRCASILLSAPLLLSACDPALGGDDVGDGVLRDMGYASAEATRTAYFTGLPRCPSYMCGLNSPFIGHELNLAGSPNDEGVRFVDAYHASYGDASVEVRGDELIAHVAGVELRGEDLIGLAIELEGEVDGNPVPLTVKLVEAAHTRMWAVAPGEDLPALVPSYKFVYDAPGVQDQLLCPASTEGAPEDTNEKSLALQQAELFDAGDVDGLLAINEELQSTSRAHHAIVYRGERFEFETAKVYTQDAKDWFNWGCAGSSASKLHLTAHTVAGSTRVGVPAPPRDVTQTMLYAYTATYCPGAPRMTVPGHPIRIADHAQLLPREGPISFGPTTDGTVEALWGAQGATCISNPRLATSDPSVTAEIASWCGDLPPCDDLGTLVDADASGSLLHPDMAVMTLNPAP